LQQVLGGALAAVAVIAHHDHRGIEVHLVHETHQGAVGEVEGADRVGRLERLGVANIHEAGCTGGKLLVGIMGTDMGKLVH